MNHTHLALALALSLTQATAQIDSYDWRLEASPPPRLGQSLHYLPGIQATVMFGGVDRYAFADTWIWQDGWKRLDTPQSPGRRYGHAVVYDSLRSRLLLVGGRDENAVLADTWSFDGTEWTQVDVLAPPPTVHLHSLAYDAGRDRVVLKGGRTTPSGQPNYDLWEFDGTTWQQIPQTGATPAGFLGSLVYDEARDDLLHWNGASLTAWDGVAWTPRDGSGLPTSSTVQLAYDPLHARVLAVNPQLGSSPTVGTYAYSGAGWTQLAATPHDNVRRTMAFDPLRQRMIGVQSATFTSDLDMDVWALDGPPWSSWRRVDEGMPRARRDGVMSYDRARRCMVLIGGAQGISAVGGLAELRDREWRFVNSGGGVVDAGAAYDEVRGHVVSYGGASPINQVLSLWDGNTWSYSSGAGTAPAGRRKCAMAYDSARARTLLFGGEPLAPAFADLWQWDGTAWSELATTGPSNRRDAAISYDRDRDRVVMFGGEDASGTFFDDTWEFDGVAWLQRAPTTSPTARSGHLLAYHEQLGRTILYGGYDGQDLTDTWLWDGTDWQPLATTHVPDAGQGVFGAYDPDRQELLVFGGGDIYGDLHGGLWRLVRTDIGAWDSIGVGCVADTQPLTLSALSAPAIGRTTTLRLDHTPPSFVTLPLAWLGFDDQQWNGVPLPIALDAFGRADCLVRASADVFVPLLPLGASAEGELALPDLPSAVGVALFVQGATFDFATGELATANLLRAVVGVP